tara:strand:- start:5460 stop:5933 length:474 start_codon:yes stop_codon:yes gene_type:complete
MQIAIINYQKETIENYGEHKSLFPNVSFPRTGPSEDWMKNNSCIKIEDHKELPNVDTKLVQVEPYLEGPIGAGGPYKVYTVQVVSLSSEEIKARQQGLENSRRILRNDLLQASDWTQMPDSPLSNSKKTEWATYRQKLRDFTSVSDWVNAELPDQPS